MLHTVIFMGRSGCGKGTQADLLRNYIHDHDYERRPIVSEVTGDKFRQYIKGSSYSAKLSKEINDAGERQPDFLAVFMWSETFIELLDEDTHLVIDGSPRTLMEAKLLTTALKFYKRENPVVIFINVSNKWSEMRLLSRHGRADDASIDKIDKRLSWFDTDVMPAIEYFKSDPYYRVLEINGEQSIADVQAEIISKYESGN